MQNKKGFTLAEVLVTLGIIGVVAALTIPVLFQNTTEDKYRIKLKDLYNELNKAAQSISYSEKKYWITHNYCTNYGTDNENIRDEFAEHLNYIAKDTIQNFTNDNKEAYYYKGDTKSSLGQILDQDRALLLANGTMIAFNDSDCSSTDSQGRTKVAKFYVDLDGLKGPDMWGVDTHLFELWKSSNNNLVVMPARYESTTDCQIDSTGVEPNTSCTIWMLYDKEMP